MLVEEVVQLGQELLALEVLEAVELELLGLIVAHLERQIQAVAVAVATGMELRQVAVATAAQVS
jgi:hypothetical protein